MDTYHQQFQKGLQEAAKKKKRVFVFLLHLKEIELAVQAVDAGRDRSSGHHPPVGGRNLEASDNMLCHFFLEATKQSKVRSNTRPIDGAGGWVGWAVGRVGRVA